MMKNIMNPLLLTTSVLGAAIILLALWIYVLERRIKQLMNGGNGASLEDTINSNNMKLNEFDRFKEEMRVELSRVDERLRKKLHGVKTLRFNPFAGTGSGGNQSFASAFLDENGDGVVLSTLYSREKLSVFAKPVTHKKSEFELTDEEKEVLK